MTPLMTSKTAWLAGATGLVGSLLLEELLAPQSPFHNVVTLGRRAPDFNNPRHTSAVVDFARLEATAPQGPCHSAFCALGTTIKKAGSRRAFRAVDYDAVLAFARVAQSRGAAEFYLVSSVGSNTRSPLFYSRVKGAVEEALGAMGFTKLVIARPSFLTGERKEQRRGEKIAFAILEPLMPFLRGPLSGLKPTPAVNVAHALVRLSTEGNSGVTVLEPRDIEESY